MVDENTCIINDSWDIVGPDEFIMISRKENRSLPDFVSMHCDMTYDDVIKSNYIPSTTLLLSSQVILDYYVYAYTKKYISEHPSASVMEVLIEFLKARQRVSKQVLGYKDNLNICVTDERFYPALLLLDYREVSYQEYKLRSGSFANDFDIVLRIFPTDENNPYIHSDRVVVQSVSPGESQLGSEYEEWVNSDFFLNSVWIAPTAGLAINPRTILENIDAG